MGPLRNVPRQRKLVPVPIVRPLVVVVVWQGPSPRWCTLFPIVCVVTLFVPLLVSLIWRLSLILMPLPLILQTPLRMASPNLRVGWDKGPRCNPLPGGPLAPLKERCAPVPFPVLLKMCLPPTPARPGTVVCVVLK